ncbi:hypothetical protein Micbo1qcDRAFT_192344 [Microdochium bolleyi]|uniref:BTB domain-containing protein n=1 Tax=Microdochium bolleyi TaxID=196109 RepID=A0A136JDP4_9PEZI|nr:hypothetical protein Micbo1qcDRAFT_192344 [Microdochium bolleyi]
MQHIWTGILLNEARDLTARTQAQQHRQAQPQPTPMSPGEAFLDAAVSRLLSNQPAHDPKAAGSESREAADSYALDNLETLHSTGDTLVIIDFPASRPPDVSCAGTHWRAKTFRVPSAALLATGSSYFAKLYSPRAQARARKRVDLSRYGSDIEYVLDLTPSSEGDELAAQLAELSIPEGVRDWWMSLERLGVSRFLVSGHDDNCPRHIDVPIEYAMKSGSVGKAKYTVGDGPLPRDNLEDIDVSQLRMIPDYCPVRHRANIIRLIRAILGEDLVLNSAVRVYTISGIAKQFDCAGVIRDSVFTWLMAQPNSDFIDIEPETALRLGWNLGLRDVTRAAMRILVAENTMDALSPTPRASRRYTLLGRTRTELPDELENVIQHATAKFAERLTQLRADFASPRVYSLLDIGEWSKLMDLGEIIGTVFPGEDAPIIDPSTIPRSSNPWISSAHIEDIRTLFNLVCKELLTYVRSMVDDVDGTSFRSDTESTTENSRLCYLPRSRFTSYFTVWHSLTTPQRGMLTDYWKRFIDTVWEWAPTGNSTKLSCAKRLNAVVYMLNSSLTLASKTDAFPPLTDNTWRLNLPLLRTQLAQKLDRLSKTWSNPTAWNAGDLEVPLSRSRHLVLSLTEEEFKYLPLWAGGLDDGTGGVFQDEPLPDADMGPIGPGPAYHTGYSVMSGAYTDMGSSSIAPSDAPTASIIGTEDGDDIGFNGGGVGRYTMDFDTETLTSGRSKVAVPTGSTVTGTREASSYAPSSVMTPSEGGSSSMFSAMARDVRTMRLATTSVDGQDNTGISYVSGVANNISTALSRGDGDVDMAGINPQNNTNNADTAKDGNRSENKTAANSTNKSNATKNEDGDDDDGWSAPSDDDDDLENFM